MAFTHALANQRHQRLLPPSVVLHWSPRNARERIVKQGVESIVKQSA